MARITTNGDLRITTQGDIRGATTPVVKLTGDASFSTRPARTANAFNMTGTAKLAATPTPAFAQNTAWHGKTKLTNNPVRLTENTLALSSTASLNALPSVTTQSAAWNVQALLTTSPTPVHHELNLTGVAQWLVMPSSPTPHALSWTTETGELATQPSRAPEQNVTINLTGKLTPIPKPPKPQITNGNITGDLTMSPQPINHQAAYQGQATATFQPIRVNHTVQMTGSAQLTNLVQRTAPKTIAWKTAGELTTAPTTVTHHFIKLTSEATLTLTPTRATPQQIHITNPAHCIIDKQKNYHFRCAQLISGWDLKQYFNLAKEIPETFLNQQIAAAGLQLYKDTGIPEKTYPKNHYAECNRKVCFLLRERISYIASFKYVFMTFSGHFQIIFRH